MRWLAALPLLFGVQQAIEGVQWLVERPSVACGVAGYGFLFFAFLVWPAYVPFATAAIETNPKRKAFLKFVAFSGVIGSLYLLVPYLTEPLTVVEHQRSILYDINVPGTVISLPFYVFAVTSGLWSSRRRVQLLGLTVLIGFFVAMFAYNYAFTSVWCFFAAVASVLVLLEVNYAAKSYHRKRRV